MKKRIIYNESAVIQILENDNSVTASSDNVLIEELEFAREFLEFKGLNVDLIEEALGLVIEPHHVVNPILVDIPSDPNEPDPDVYRKALYAGFFNYPLKNYMILNIRVMHFRMIEGEETHVFEKDFVYRLRSDNTTFVLPSPTMDLVPEGTPGSIGEYNFYWMLIGGYAPLGIEPTPYPYLIAQAMQLAGQRNRYNTLPPII